MDRRIFFFLGAAVACASLIPVADSDLRWVPLATSVTYLVLAAAVWFDGRTKRREQ
jgi:hypothetical protein